MAASPDTSSGSTFDQVGRRRPPRSHTHLSKSDIIRELAIGPVERLLLWLAKTDYYVLHVVPNQSRLTLAGLGLMVIFTSSLAFITGLYALLTMIVPPDSAWRWHIALPIVLIYAFGIMIIDREIVGAVSKKSLIIRFFFAIGIAFVVSWPAKLKLFEGRVAHEIALMQAEEVAPKEKRIEELTRTGRPERQQQRMNLQASIDSDNREVGMLDEQIEREAKIVECGPKCEAYREKKQQKVATRDAKLRELEALSMPAALPAGVEREIERLRAEVDQGKKPRYDLLSNWEALDRISQKSGTAYQVMSGFVLLFFMLLEMVPLGLKLGLGKTEYNYYLEARTNLNNQKIISLANLYMEEMQKDPRAVIDKTPAEITDIMAWHIEDESREHTAPFDTRSLMEIEAANRAARAQEGVGDEVQNYEDWQGARPETTPSAFVESYGISQANPGEAPYDQTEDEEPPQR